MRTRPAVNPSEYMVNKGERRGCCERALFTDIHCMFTAGSATLELLKNVAVGVAVGVAIGIAIGWTLNR